MSAAYGQQGVRVVLALLLCHAALQCKGTNVGQFGGVDDVLVEGDYQILGVLVGPAPESPGIACFQCKSTKTVAYAKNDLYHTKQNSRIYSHRCSCQHFCITPGANVVVG